MACGNAAVQVHHKRYDLDTLAGRSIVDLVSLCRACHVKAEFREDGRKVPLSKANRRLGRLASDAEFRAASAPALPTIDGPWLLRKSMLCKVRRQESDTAWRPHRMQRDVTVGRPVEVFKRRKVFLVDGWFVSVASGLIRNASFYKAA
jgi:hypothetical protein